MRYNEVGYGIGLPTAVHAMFPLAPVRTLSSKAVPQPMVPNVGLLRTADGIADGTADARVADAKEAPISVWREEEGVRLVGATAWMLSGHLRDDTIEYRLFFKKLNM